MDIATPKRFGEGRFLIAVVLVAALCPTFATAGCRGDSCAAGCEGTHCAIRCAGDSCGKGCRGTQCGYGCFGHNCNDGCEGPSCGGGDNYPNRDCSAYTVEGWHCNELNAKQDCDWVVTDSAFDKGECRPGCTTGDGGKACENGGIITGNKAAGSCRCDCTGTGYEGRPNCDTTCPGPGDYFVEPVTGGAVRACLPCEAGMYSTATNHRNTDCDQQQPTCPGPGDYYLDSRSAERTCQGCDAGKFSSATNHRSAETCTDCPSNTYQDGSDDTASRGACTTQPFCGIGEHISIGIKPTERAVCTACDGAVEHQSQTNHRDAACKPHTSCGKNEFFVPSNISSEVCFPCPTGTTQLRENQTEPECEQTCNGNADPVACREDPFYVIERCSDGVMGEVLSEMCPIMCGTCDRGGTETVVLGGSNAAAESNKPSNAGTVVLWVLVCVAVMGFAVRDWTLKRAVERLQVGARQLPVSYGINTIAMEDNPLARRTRSGSGGGGADAEGDVHGSEATGGFGYLAYAEVDEGNGGAATTLRLDEDMYVADESAPGGAVVYAIPLESEEHNELAGSHTAHATTTST